MQEEITIQGERYKGKFRAEARKYKGTTGREYTERDATDHNWNGTGLIEDEKIGERYQFLFSQSRSTYPEKGFEGDMITFRREKSESGFGFQHNDFDYQFTNEGAVRDLFLENLIEQVKEKGKEQEPEPIPKVRPHSLGRLGLMGRGLVKAVLDQDVIDGVYYNLEQVLQPTNGTDLFSDHKISLEFLGQDYRHSHTGFIKDEREFLIISPNVRDNNFPIFFKTQDGEDLRKLEISLVYFEAPEVKKVEGNCSAHMTELAKKLAKLIIPDQTDEKRANQILTIDGRLYQGQLVRDGKKILVVGQPLTSHKLREERIVSNKYTEEERDAIIYSGEIIPHLVDQLKK